MPAAGPVRTATDLVVVPEGANRHSSDPGELTDAEHGLSLQPSRNVRVKTPVGTSTPTPESLPDRCHPGRRAWCQQDMHILRLPLAVLAAAALTAACTVPAHAVTGWQPAESVPANAAASSAPYYVIGGVSVVNGFTGATLATIHGPDHRPHRSR